ncbi:MAG TPA: YkgJ family cysteine cluster protein [Myxococcota bacterium]|jgi:hypothetical protein|nr:YkgJ family cysteine cluster protein [Myxococcota bacterium]
MQLQFTFADGAFRYDCRTCGAKCCKGYGIGLDAAAAVRLTAERPALRAMLRATGGGELVAHNAADGCWFLDREGLCALERGSGRAAKPAACRLFPFNRLFRVGEERVVDVNTLLCPIEDAGGGGVTHDELRAELEALGDTAIWGRAEPPAGRDAADALADERLFAAAVARAAADAEPDFAVAAAQADPGAGDAVALQALRRAAAACLGLPPELATAASPATTRVLLLAGPSLRFNALFTRPVADPATVGSGAAGVAVGAAALVDPARVTRALVALDVLLRAARALGGTPPSIRAATELFQARGPLLAVLARATDRLWLDPASGAVLTTAAPEALQGPLFALAAQLLQNRSRACTLGELLEVVAPDPLARALLVPWAAPLVGRLAAC